MFSRHERIVPQGRGERDPGVALDIQFGTAARPPLFVAL